MPIIYKVLRFLLVISAIFGIYLTIKYTIIFLYPIILAMLLSILINPSVTFIENKLRFPRALAAFIIICSLFILILGIIIVIITELIQGSTYLAEQIPAHFKTLFMFVKEFLNTKMVPYYQKGASFFQTLNSSQQITITDNINQLTEQIASTGGKLLQNVLLTIPSFLSKLPQFITIFLFIVLATFLITIDFYSIKKIVKHIIPSTATNYSKDLLMHLRKSVNGFFKAQAILIFITASIILIGLLILRVDHALTITLLAAAVDLFPYVGTGIIFVPWIIFNFISEDYSMTIGLSILYMVVIVFRQILEPKILSTYIGLSPLLTLFTLFIGIQIFGVLGLVIAPIILVLTNAFYQAGLITQLLTYIKG